MKVQWPFLTRAQKLGSSLCLPIAYLEEIWVLPSYQQTGIGRQLIDYAKSWARKKGLSQLASNCHLTNLVSQQVHQALGFEEVSRTVN